VTPRQRKAETARRLIATLPEGSETAIREHLGVERIRLVVLEDEPMPGALVRLERNQPLGGE
jgi:hypothetical protein